MDILDLLPVGHRAGVYATELVRSSLGVAAWGGERLCRVRIDRRLPRDLIDREEEMTLLRSLGGGGQSARLSGPRPYGKTTLIGRLAQTMREDHDFAVAYVDLSRIMGIDDSHSASRRPTTPRSQAVCVEPGTRCLVEASDGLRRTWDSLSANQRKLVGALAVGHSHPLRATALEHAGLARARHLGANGAARAKTLTTDAMVERYFALYHEVVEERHGMRASVFHHQRT